MSLNTNKLYPIASVSEFAFVQTAPVSQATAHNGTAPEAVLLVTGGTNESYIDSIKVSHFGTNPETVIRIFLCKGDKAMFINNVLVGSKKIPAYTINETDQDVITEILPEGEAIAIKPGYRLYAITSVTLPAGVMVHATGGIY